MNKLSAFGDEIAADLEEQLAVLNKLEVDGLDLRAAWDTNISQMSDEQVQRAKQLCDDHGIVIRCIGSPIGKSPIEDSIDNELERLRRIIDVCGMVGTPNIRMFSFYPPTNDSSSYIQTSIERLQKLVDLAAANDVILLLENEKGLVGDTPGHCLQLLQAIDSPHLRFIWDPANFVQEKVERQVERFWDTLAPFIGYVHIKDAVLADGSVRAAGEGDGQLDLLIEKLYQIGYDGVLSLEPHLAHAGHMSGFSGPDKMEYAVNALRKLLKEKKPA